MIHTALALVALWQLAAPSTASAIVSYPTLGYTLLAGRLVRFAGIPGACYSTPDASPTTYTHIQTATATRAVLLATGGDSPTLLYRTPLTDTTIALTETPLAVAISPSGSYFAALSASHLWLYRRAGLTPLVTIDIASLAAPIADVSALLVGDNGDIVINTPSAFWYSATPTALPGPTFSMISIPATFLRFAPRDHLLVGYQPGQGRVIALHPTSAFAIEPLITAQDSFTPITGLEFSADGLSVWISQQAGPLLNYDLAQRHTSAYTVQAGAIASVTAPGVYLWSTPDQSASSILDTTRAVPTVLVVPAGQSSQDSQ
jgi:hypothetical protein